MKKFFGFDSPLFQLLSKLGDMVVLNLLWLVGCLPVFTIGASTTALYYCTRKLQKEGSIKIFREFWKSFLAEFKQATVLFVVLIFVLLILAADIYIMFVGFDTGIAGRAFACILLFLVYPAACFVFPLQARFENQIFQTLKNALLMSLSHLPISLLVAVLNLLPIILLYFWPVVFYKSFIVWLLIGGALIAYFSTLLLNFIFKKYEVIET